jgi:PDZ domain-containing protein
VEKRGRDWLRTLLWVIAVVALAAVVAWFIPTGYVAYVPGTTGNLARMVHVEGGKRVNHGKLLMVAIGILPLNGLLYAVMRFNPVYEVLPRSYVLPDMNFQQFIALNYAMMDQSQALAAVEGEDLAGLPARVETLPGVMVAGLLRGGSAAGRLKLGDRIVAVGPYAVGMANLRTVMRRFHFGETVNFTVMRGRERLLVPLKLGHLAGDPAPAVGVVIAPAVHYVIPRPVRFITSNIGGPSAGMMFALEIYQQVTGHNLARGRVVAGTGEILPGGQIGAIGGVAQKVVTVADAGARVFLCPIANYAKAERTARLLNLNVRILPVRTLKQALSDLEGPS